MVKTWFASKFARTEDPLLQPVIHITLVLTCFGTVVFGHLSEELGFRFPRSRPLFISKLDGAAEIDFKSSGFRDQTKLRYWELTSTSFYIVFNGTHYAPCKVIGGKFTELCTPRMLLKNPAAFSYQNYHGVMFLHKCDSVEYDGHCVALAPIRTTACEISGQQAAFFGVISYDLKDVGSPLGLHSYGAYTYAFLALASDNQTVSVTRACTIHWSRPARGIFPNYGAILKLQNCADNSTFPIFVNFFKTAKYITIGYLDAKGSIHLCFHNFTQIDNQFDSIREQCDRASKSPSLWTISDRGKEVAPCVRTDRPYSCAQMNFLNQIVYYDKIDTYGALYFKFDEITVTPDNPILNTFEFEVEKPFNKSTLLISQKNNVVIINGLEDFDQYINPDVVHVNLSLDYIDPVKNIIYLYKPNTADSFIPHPIYSCEILPQQQCKLTLECDLCGLECKTQRNFNCPARKRIAPSSVINPLILSNGVLEIAFNPNGRILNINATLEAPYNIFININASYIPTTSRIKCKLNSWNDSIEFPFYKTINVFLTINVSPTSQTSLSRTEYFELTDIVQLVDPVIERIVSDSILVDHPSRVTFELKRIASKHINTVKIVLHNLTFGCSSFEKSFDCSLTFPSGIYWSGYASIFVANTFFESFPLQLNPYPIFYKTVWHNFPGYSVPFHFIGQYFSSFHNLKISLKLVNVTKPIQLNCTVNSDTDLYCKFDNFPGKLPVFGNFVFHSHSNPLEKLPNLSVNLNVPPAITSAVYSKDEKTIKISTSNYFADYLTNTSISVIQCNTNCSKVKCGQIVFSSIQNTLTCKVETNYSNKSSEWLAVIEIGLHRLNIVVTDEPEKKENRPKIISSFKFSIYTLLALILLLILALGVYYLRKEIDRLKLTAVSTKLSDAHRKGSRKLVSMSRLNSVTKMAEFRPFDSRESTQQNPEMLTNQFAFFTKRI